MDTPAEVPAFELERVTLDPEASETGFADFGAISIAIGQTGKQIRSLARKDRQISETNQETRKRSIKDSKLPKETQRTPLHKENFSRGAKECETRESLQTVQESKEESNTIY